MTPTVDARILAVVADRVPTLTLPALSRFTMAFAVLKELGGTVQCSPSVPLPVTGVLLTVKSVEGALNPTLVTDPVPGNFCPAANVNSPLSLSFKPVSEGWLLPEP
jgi:hypothetical protein